MSNARWDSPYDHTIVFSLFKKNFTELNNAYWAYVPAVNKINKLVKQEVQDNKRQPIDFFIVHDEDDRRLASTFEEWRGDFNEFQNYTQLNFLMLLNSCFETYLRTIVSIAIESKPGVIIQCKDAVDGVTLLRNRLGYGDIEDKEYQFSNAIESITKGTWQSRNGSYIKLFSNSPLSDDDIKKLDELRTLRNRIGHFFARDDRYYKTPLYSDYRKAERLSHDRLISYFALVFSVVNQIDNHLQKDYIGSYDIIKYYYGCISDGTITGVTTGQKAQMLQTMLGHIGLKPVSREFCANLITTCSLEDSNEICIFISHVCLRMINKYITEKNIELIYKGKRKRLTRRDLKRYIMENGFQEDTCIYRKVSYHGGEEYFYSKMLIDKIVEHIINNVGKTALGYEIMTLECEK